MTQDIVLMAFNHVAHADNVSKSTNTQHQGEDSITKMALKVKMYEEYGNFSEFSEGITFDETKKISIRDDGIIKLIEKIRH